MFLSLMRSAYPLALLPHPHILPHVPKFPGSLAVSGRGANLPEIHLHILQYTHETSGRVFFH